MNFALNAVRLRYRWKGQDQRLEAILDDLRRGGDWTQRLAADPGGRWKELPHSRSISNSASAELAKDLRGVHLRACDLSAVTGLVDARMEYAVIEDVNLKNASLMNCNLDHARIAKHTSLENANLRYARLRKARLHQVSLDGAVLEEVNLSGAQFRDVTFQGTLFKKIELSREPALWPAGRTQMAGDDVSGRALHQNTDEFFRRFVDGEAAIWALRREKPLVAGIWYLLTNYGRSAGRLLAWVVFGWLFFGWLYAGLPLPARLESRTMSAARELVRPSIVTASGGSPEGFAPFYFSAVTLTTLGYGDILPAPGDWKAQTLVILEATFGLLAWGCLVAILLQSLQR